MFTIFAGIALECNRDEWVARMRRMGSCPCKQLGRSIARFHSNPTGKCLFGRSAALLRLSIAGLWTAHRALHPIPKRYLCDPGKIVNTFSGEQVLRHAVFTPYGLALDAPDGVDQPWGQHITRGAAVASPHTQNQHVVGITQRQIHVV